MCERLDHPRERARRRQVEAFSTDAEPLARSAHVWRDTFASKDQLARDGLAFLRDRWAAA